MMMISERGEERVCDIDCSQYDNEHMWTSSFSRLCSTIYISDLTPKYGVVMIEAAHNV